MLSNVHGQQDTEPLMPAVLILFDCSLFTRETTHALCGGYVDQRKKLLTRIKLLASQLGDLICVPLMRQATA